MWRWPAAKWCCWILTPSRPPRKWAVLCGSGRTARSTSAWARAVPAQMRRASGTCSERSSALTRTGAFRQTIPSSARPRARTGQSGPWVCATRFRFPSSPAPDAFLSTMSAAAWRRRSTRGWPERTTAGRPARAIAVRPMPASAIRFTATFVLRPPTSSRAAPSTIPPPRFFPRSMWANIFSQTTSPAGFVCLIRPRPT